MNLEMNVPVKMNGRIEQRAVSGVRCGPFLIHLSTTRLGGKWTVTHIKTGYVVTKAPTKRAASVAAKRFIPVTNWDFEEPSFVSGFTPSLMTIICAIKSAAERGDVA